MLVFFAHKFLVLIMGKHRSRLQIIERILSVINDNKEVRKTQIMYKAYLSYKLLNNYLCDVLKAGLVLQNGTRYKLTPKGERFLARFGEYDHSREVIEEKLSTVEDQRLMLEEMCSRRKASNLGSRSKDN